MRLLDALQTSSPFPESTRDEDDSCKRTSLPHADEDVPVPENEEEDVLLGHVMEVGALLVGKEQVGLPQTLEHLGVDGEGVGLEVLWQLQPRVVPALPQEDVDSVILEGTAERG